MSVSDGQAVNAAVTNAAFLSRTTNSDTTAIVGLNHASSGGLITNAQQSINDNAADIITNSNAIAQRALLTDTRFPTVDEKNALVGTEGSPSTSNKYVTDQDKRLLTDEDTFTIGNNQISAANIAGLLFNSANNHGVVVHYMIRRRTDSEERMAIGKLTLFYLTDSSTWEIQDESASNAYLGVTFTITAGGQVQYSSDSMAGGNYYGQINFKVMKFDELFSS